ncbi:hypothetical protein KCP69_26920 (plasmid) [Salmonella enterica subsp. enterica]|nr:hypothetical protein KCP69_26920 [Salmonella enterica subsp. enterica]
MYVDFSAGHRRLFTVQPVGPLSSAVVCIPGNSGNIPSGVSYGVSLPVDGDIPRRRE